MPEEIYVLEMARYQEFAVPMEEPSKQDYNSVLQTLNESFSEWNYDVLRPQFQVKDGSICALIVPDDVIITLPTKINEYLEIPVDSTFEGVGRIPVGEKIQTIEIQKN